MGINVIKILNNLLPQQALLTIYKSFLRPNLDYGNIIYDQPSNWSLSQTSESFQYKATLAIKGTIKGTSQAKLYKELDLEALKFRRWSTRLCTSFKVKTFGLPLYLLKYILEGNHSYNTQLNESGLSTYHYKTDVFKYLFPYTISEWNRLHLHVRKARSLLKMFC